MKRKILTITIGADMDSDFNELFSDKPFSEIKQAKNMLYLESYAQLNKLLSPKRMDLLKYLMEHQSAEKPQSIGQIAKELNRHQEAISRDINQLKKLGLVALKRFKQTIYAIPEYSSINIKVC
ncbi:MAG: helix-turn-helix domain-containing protein [Candidatus Diapherotrites archaeon]|nr:helix-turn-helix domain-containing protein [Candidatus Diapherotrites archaeon]